jgi:hypothetical protein
MAEFRPHVHMQLSIGDTYYTCVQHPLFPDDEEEVYAIEGGEAIIYQLRAEGSDQLWALKVCKPQYRGSHIARSTAALAPYATLAGLALSNRICLTRTTHKALIAQYPDLEYAVLMPWLQGRTWAGLISDRAASKKYTLQTARTLATAMSRVLWDLETYSLAHTDIAGGNVIISDDFKRVELLDIENLYIPKAPAPRLYSRGSPGYQHRHLDQRGYWRPDGDRFAGAIILTEMLAWCDPYVQGMAPPKAEVLFQPDELQIAETPRWQAVRDALWNICPQALPLFDRAWASSDLARCPELSDWAMVLIRPQGNL